MKNADPIYLGDHATECPLFIRADAEALCSVCGKMYKKHQQYSWGSPDFLLYLYKTCDGLFWKP